MRPDAHKKKKSAQYQKKNPEKLQGKTQRKSKAGENEKPGKPDKPYEQRLNRREDDKKEKEEVKKIVAAALAGGSDSSGSDGEGEQPVRRTFRRRKVENNWEKYEEPEVDYSIVSKEEQQEEKQKEEDFQQHLRAKVKAHSPLLLQDEEDDDSHGHVLSVDSKEITEDFRKMLHSDDIKSEPSDSRSSDIKIQLDSLYLPCESRNSITDSKSTLEVSISASVLEESKAENDLCEEICTDAEVWNDVPVVKDNELDEKPVVNDNDSVLDCLLSLDTPVVTPLPKKDEAQKHMSDNKANPSIRASITTSEKKQPAAGKESLQDLEDWLNSVI